ncbi:MAG TPA: OpgC domain-containing protein, partial [Pseudolabrys sp.]|nr:OpgC domain-containing protein [Pseudolabrys sp.]
LAWQFLFVIGATAGYAPYSRQVLTMPSAWLAKLAIGITVAVAIIHISWTIHGAYEAFPGLLLQELSPLVDDKANLAPLRLASFLALAVTAGHLVRRNNRLLHTPVARLIIRCGQHSLQVFCLGVLLAVLGEILLTSVRDDIAMQLAISLAGIMLMVAIGGLLTWYKEGNAMRSDAVIAADTNAAR